MQCVGGLDLDRGLRRCRQWWGVNLASGVVGTVILYRHACQNDTLVFQNGKCRQSNSRFALSLTSSLSLHLSLCECVCVWDWYSVIFVVSLKVSFFLQYICLEVSRCHVNVYLWGSVCICMCVWGRGGVDCGYGGVGMWTCVQNVFGCGCAIVLFGCNKCLRACPCMCMRACVRAEELSGRKLCIIHCAHIMDGPQLLSDCDPQRAPERSAMADGVLWSCIVQYSIAARQLSMCTRRRPCVCFFRATVMAHADDVSGLCIPYVFCRSWWSAVHVSLMDSVIGRPYY